MVALTAADSRTAPSRSRRRTSNWGRHRIARKPLAPGSAVTSVRQGGVFGLAVFSSVSTSRKVSGPVGQGLAASSEMVIDRSNTIAAIRSLPAARPTIAPSWLVIGGGWWAYGIAAIVALATETA